MTSTLDYQLGPSRHDKELEAQDTEPSSDEDDEEEVSAKKKFEEIIRELKSGRLDLRNETKLEEFGLENASYLDQKTTGDGDHNTLLHMLVEDSKDKVFDTYQPLVKLLLERHPQLLGEKDSNEKTPLYIAISKKRDRLVRFMCDVYPHIDTVLGIPCYHSENCLHVAIRRNVSPKLAIFLIKKAGEGTLCAKDDKGNTPLNIAVDYERCTETQLEIVEALIERCDKAMDERTNAPGSFSPYRYHEYTRAEALKKAAEADVKKAPREEKDIVPGKVERPSASEHEEPGRDTSGSKAKNTRQANDPKVPMPIEIPRPQAPGIPAPGSEPTKGGFGIRRVNTGEKRLPAETPGYKYPKFSEMALNIPSRTAGAGGSDGTRTPVSTKPVRTKKRAKEEAKVTEESADVILNCLKLHCMRTRNHDDVVDFLYGRNQDKQIFFDLYDTSALTISEERIEDGLAHLKFEDVLQYVALPGLKLERRSASIKTNKKSPVLDGKGRTDLIFLFNWLRSKGVKRVIRVIVDDTLEPSHSDEAIETALGGFKVEIWDWKKIDLCTETIVTAAPDTMVVYLYWSGNNAVLRGWSEPGGLNQLKKLGKVHLHVGKGLETGKRTRSNVREFQRRLKLLRPEVEVDIVEEHDPVKHDLTGGPVDTAREQVEHRHKWLTCMDEFVDFIQNVDPPLPLREEVTIALIDDGVDINEQSLHAKIIGGRSFCQRDKFQNLSKPYYVTSGGHGTVMASLICRVCPKAQIYVVKLDEHMSDNSKRQITAQSAAKAVRAAIDRKVHIISMSWTIERTAHNTADIQELESAIVAAANAGILMFCAANDQGVKKDESFPAACGGTKHLFKIGAAEASGAVWKWVGDPADVDFIFPGHNVVKDRPNDMPIDKCATLTGSSVATAIAAGLAALVLYCVQLGALQSLGQGGSAITMEDFRSIKGHERMKEAFLAIGTSQASGNKYIEVWDVFGPAAKKAERVGREGKIDIVTEVASRLKTRRTFE